MKLGLEVNNEKTVYMVVRGQGNGCWMVTAQLMWYPHVNIQEH